MILYEDGELLLILWYCLLPDYEAKTHLALRWASRLATARLMCGRRPGLARDARNDANIYTYILHVASTKGNKLFLFATGLDGGCFAGELQLASGV